MKCRNCGRAIPENSIFCCWCGKKQLKERKKEISVPKPTQRKSGLWIAQIMIDGKRTTVSAATEADYYAKARALKAGLLDEKDPIPRRTLDSVVQDFLSDRSHVLSPTTLRNYKSYWKNHFLAYHNRQICSIDFQRMVNDEYELCHPPIVKKAWSMVATALNCVDVRPRVILAPTEKVERAWLSDSQILAFLPLVRGEECELTALLGLHSLRESEIGGLVWSDYDGTSLHVHQAYVRGEAGMILKPLPKTDAGNRTIPVFIPRLKELLDAVPPDERTGTIIRTRARTDSGRIKRICLANGLGSITNHCLRHSFCTLCHRLKVPMLVTQRLGGWNDLGTVQKIYTHLDDADKISASTELQSFYGLITTVLLPPE